MSTVHGYTQDQNLQDGPHKDLRRARAAGLNIVPTTTGAAIATTEAIPELKGLFDGLAFRVPVPVGSVSYVVALLGKKTTVEEVNAAYEKAVSNPIYKGVLAVTREPLVSHDIIGRSESSIVDLELTKVVDGDLVQVVSWYDNEFGYSNRLVEQVINVGKS
jgi:glyceraldehyde 3-phosphate dehydrogenase